MTLAPILQGLCVSRGSQTPYGMFIYDLGNIYDHISNNFHFSENRGLMKLLSFIVSGFFSFAYIYIYIYIYMYIYMYI